MSLLERLRQPNEQEAWGRFVEFYTPLLLGWARGVGLQEADAADLVQEVFQILVRRLPEFTYDRTGSFRAWLRSILLNQWRTGNRRRRAQPLGATPPELESPDSIGELIDKSIASTLLGVPFR